MLGIPEPINGRIRVPLMGSNCSMFYVLCSMFYVLCSKSRDFNDLCLSSPTARMTVETRGSKERSMVGMGLKPD